MPKPKAAKAKKPAAATPVTTLADALAAITEPKKLPTAVVLSELPDLEGPNGPLDSSIKQGLVRAIIAGKLSSGSLARLVATEITRESRDAFAVALLELWEKKEFHGRMAWVLDGVSSLAGDRSTLALASYMASWPSQGDTGRKRAIGAVPALVAAGTDTALLALVALRQTAVVPSVLEAVIDGLAAAVEARHTTLSELLDTITPTLGLDAHGKRVFDYGQRRFTVAFDDFFEPRLYDDQGAHIDALPEPQPGDDPAHVSAARAAWDTLSAQLREAVKVQTFRLEQDMITARRWDASTWTHALKEHPLLVSFTRRIVWGVYDEDGALRGAFRTAEDQSLVTRDDAELVLPAGARIGIVHPLHLDDAERAAWAGHFADYEIIQPFAQLGRAVHRVAEAERAETKTARFATTQFKSGVLRDVLVRKGWERDPAFFRSYYQRTFAHDRVVAIATMDPGVQAGSASYDVADQTIASIEFRKKVGRGKSQDALPLGEVPPVAFSEAIVDLSDVLAEQAD